MTQKKTIPWGGLVAVLFFMEVLAYYASGLYLFSDVTINNYSEKLTYILLHFYKFWWNEKTPAIIGIALILWIMAVSYFLTYYRNYHFYAEHGVAEWEDVEKASKKVMEMDNPLITYLSQNISINSKSFSNMNLLAANCTNVVLDIKGDLLKKHGNFL